MSITALHSYLVFPSKSLKENEKPSVGGTKLNLEGKLFDMLRGVYEKSDTECTIDIAFRHAADGNQQNDCRDLLVRYVEKPSLPGGRAIAERLQGVTTNRSGLGLLFLMAGKEEPNHKLVVSRFPAEHGILAEQNRDALTVEFLERVFMKNAHAYKAVVYTASSTASGFWSGRAVDKQINAQMLALADYWIRDFLVSDFKTTSAAGTKRLANAFRGAITSAESISVKEELLAASRLTPSLKGKSVSVSSVAKRYSLTAPAIEALKEQLPGDHLFTEQFTLSEDEFTKHIAFESTELDNGGILTAPAGKFAEVFKEKPVRGEQDEVEFTTKGRVINRRLRKTKG